MKRKKAKEIPERIFPFTFRRSPLGKRALFWNKCKKFKSVCPETEIAVRKRVFFTRRKRRHGVRKASPFACFFTVQNIKLQTLRGKFFLRAFFSSPRQNGRGRFFQHGYKCPPFEKNGRKKGRTLATARIAKRDFPKRNYCGPLLKLTSVKKFFEKYRQNA